jgi:hypothetical protein
MQPNAESNIKIVDLKFMNQDTQNHQTPETDSLPPSFNSAWLVAELDPESMAAVSGGAILRRKALNRWTFQFQRNTLKLTNVRARVTSLLTDVTNRQANLDLSSQFHGQLSALEGNRQLADELYRAIGLPVPN